jgi:hypothetical protein
MSGLLTYIKFYKILADGRGFKYKHNELGIDSIQVCIPKFAHFKF